MRVVVDHPKLELDWFRVLQSVHGRVTKWADLNIIRSILAQQDISECVDFLHQRIDTCIASYHVLIFFVCICGRADFVLSLLSR
jgi:hypothetical protein